MSPLSAETPRGFDLCRPCLHCHGLCEFTRESVLRFLGVLHSIFSIYDVRNNLCVQVCSSLVDKINLSSPVDNPGKIHGSQKEDNTVPERLVCEVGGMRVGGSLERKGQYPECTLCLY